MKPSFKGIGMWSVGVSVVVAICALCCYAAQKSSFNEPSALELFTSVKKVSKPEWHQSSSWQQNPELVKIAQENKAIPANMKGFVDPDGDVGVRIKVDYLTNPQARAAIKPVMVEDYFASPLVGSKDRVLDMPEFLQELKTLSTKKSNETLAEDLLNLLYLYSNVPRMYDTHPDKTDYLLKEQSFVREAVDQLKVIEPVQKTGDAYNRYRLLLRHFDERKERNAAFLEKNRKSGVALLGDKVAKDAGYIQDSIAQALVKKEKIMPDAASWSMMARVKNAHAGREVVLDVVTESLHDFKKTNDDIFTDIENKPWYEKEELLHDRLIENDRLVALVQENIRKTRVALLLCALLDRLAFGFEAEKASTVYWRELVNSAVFSAMNAEELAIKAPRESFDRLIARDINKWWGEPLVEEFFKVYLVADGILSADEAQKLRVLGKDIETFFDVMAVSSSRKNDIKKINISSVQKDLKELEKNLLEQQQKLLGYKESLLQPYTFIVASLQEAEKKFKDVLRTWRAEAQSVEQRAEREKKLQALFKKKEEEKESTFLTMLRFLKEQGASKDPATIQLLQEYQEALLALDIEIFNGLPSVDQMNVLFSDALNLGSLFSLQEFLPAVPKTAVIRVDEKLLSDIALARNVFVQTLAAKKIVGDYSAYEIRVLIYDALRDLYEAQNPDSGYVFVSK